MKSVLLLAMLALSALCLTAQEPKPTPTLFAEVVSTDSKEVKSKFVQYFRRICSQSADRSYIINYGTAEEVRKRRGVLLEVINEDDSRCGRYDPPRITFVDALRESGIRTKLWIVPPGADNPNP